MRIAASLLANDLTLSTTGPVEGSDVVASDSTTYRVAADLLKTTEFAAIATNHRRVFV